MSGRGLKFKLSELPEHMRAQVRAQLGDQPKRPPRGMSKTERLYQAELEAQRRIGTVLFYRYEPARLILAAKTTYCPDFMVRRVVERLVMVEVKPRKSDGRAYWTEDSRVKFKTAAETFSEFFAFEAVWPDGDGGWCTETYSARPK